LLIKCTANLSSSTPVTFDRHHCNGILLRKLSLATCRCHLEFHSLQWVPKSNPMGNILYFWNCVFCHQIYSIYRWGFRPHIMHILLK